MPDMLTWAGTALQIVVVDILLSADNAVLIALASQSLQPHERRKAFVAGTIGAVAMRLLFASGFTFVLQVPLLKLLGGVALLVITIRLVTGGVETISDPQPANAPGTLAADVSGLWRAVAAMLVGDVAMSLDNVVAVAALANGNLMLLFVGLAVSVPLLVFGSTLLRRAIEGSPSLVLLAGMLLGWVAGSIAVTDPAISGFVAQQAPALTYSLPLGAATLVLWQALIHRCSGRSVLSKL